MLPLKLSQCRLMSPTHDTTTGQVFESDEVPSEALPKGALGLAIIGFTPSWFSVNMGTGVLSTLIHQAPHQFKGMKDIGTALYLLNCFLFVLFLGISCARYTMYPYVWRHLIRYPPQCFFLGTLPCGLSTIVAATAYIAVPKYGHWAVDLALVLWWINVVLAVATCVGVPFLMFTIHHLTLDKMTGAWLLPVVPAIVAAAAGSVVATVLSPDLAVTVIGVCYILWGMGVGLAILILALYFHRLSVYNLPDAEVVVSAFLPVGPLGQGAFGIIQLAQSSKEAFRSTGFLGQTDAGDIVFAVSAIVGLMMWGFGLWWLCHGMYSVITRRLKGHIRFNMGFWGFIFPLGVFNSATYALSNALPSAFFSYVAMVFLVSLILLYIWVVLGTLQGVYNKTLLFAPCLTDMYSASVHGGREHVPSSRNV